MIAEDYQVQYKACITLTHWKILFDWKDARVQLMRTVASKPARDFTKAQVSN
jgi:hypothetical protein